MISDVLSQAVDDIRWHLRPEHPLRYDYYDPEFMMEIEALLMAMDGLRKKLDTPPKEQ
jgi:hypothetical protein